MIYSSRKLPFGKKIPRVEVRFGKPLDFSRYEGLSGDRFVERSITDEIMYEIMDAVGPGVRRRLRRHGEEVDGHDRRQRARRSSRSSSRRRTRPPTAPRRPSPAEPARAASSSARHVGECSQVLISATFLAGGGGGALTSMPCSFGMTSSRM